MNFFKRPIKSHLRVLWLTSAMLSCAGHCDQLGGQADSRSVRIFVWGEYTSQKLFDDFTAKTGIDVIESNYSSNEELLAKIQTGAGGYDLIIPSDYMVQVMSRLDLLRPLSHEQIPNIKHVEPGLLNQDFDPQNKFSLPYSYAVTGITYNKDRLSRPIGGYSELWTNDQLPLRFSVLDDSREVFAAALKKSGYSANTQDIRELQEAKNQLINIKTRIREFTSTPASLLESGDLLAAQMYSNESLRLMARDSRFNFVLPSEGYLLSMDNFAVPKTSRRPELAHVLINFLLDPANNLIFASEIMTAPVTIGTRHNLPEPIRSHPAIQPFSALLIRGEMLRDVGQKILDYDRMWTELKVAGS